MREWGIFNLLTIFLSCAVNKYWANTNLSWIDSVKNDWIEFEETDPEILAFL